MVDAVMSLVDLEVSDPEDHRYDDGSKLAAQICRAVLALAPQPAPAPLSDDVVKDAALWRALESCVFNFHGGKNWMSIMLKSDAKPEPFLKNLLANKLTVLAAQGGG